MSSTRVEGKVSPRRWAPRETNQVRLWTDELRRRATSGLPEDSGLARLAFAQARACVVSDLWPRAGGVVCFVRRRFSTGPSSRNATGRRAVLRCPVEDAALVAAVQLAGAQQKEPLTGAAVRAALPGLLPKRVLGAKTLEEWELDVLVELGFRMDDPRSSARADYLAVAETWDAFGTAAKRRRGNYASARVGGQPHGVPRRASGAGHLLARV